MTFTSDSYCCGSLLTLPQSRAFYPNIVAWLAALLVTQITCLEPGDAIPSSMASGGARWSAGVPHSFIRATPHHHAALRAPSPAVSARCQLNRAKFGVVLRRVVSHLFNKLASECLPAGGCRCVLHMHHFRRAAHTVCHSLGDRSK